MKSRSDMAMSTYLQLFDFNKAKDDVKELTLEREST